MTAKDAYEAYKNSLNARTRNWHNLKAETEHKEKSDSEFDIWLRENKSDALPRYFMGEYDAMPAHTKAGWEAFATHAERGAEEAWTSYVTAARLNFHGDAGFRLPAYTELDGDQHSALDAAVSALHPSSTFGY